MGKTSISARLVKALSRIDRPGTFCTSGSAAFVLPGLEVAGVGMIGLPLVSSQLEELKRHCEQAPYGKGQETLVDMSVRRVWRLTPDRFALTNPAWNDFLGERVAEIQASLGLEGQSLEAHLYDLLLYEAGSFFLPHQDGEKLDRMVATLVVVLPSVFEGGELIVEHEGQKQVVDFSGPESRFKIQFAAFYADCEHEVKPLRSGHRLCLIYNLTLTKPTMKIGAPRTSERVTEIANVLHAWKESADSPTKLAVTLEHQYTQDGLEWDALKGVDRAKAQVLFDAAAQAGFHAYLALVTFWESGSAEGGDYEYDRHRRYGRGRYDDDDGSEGTHEMGEIYDSSLTAENWRGPAGEKLPFGKIPVERDEVAPPESLTEVDPEEDFEGYTGNAGMTLDRWYRHAAICLWPDEKHLDVLCQIGSRQALPALARMVVEWRDAKVKEAGTIKSRCIEFAGKILAKWPENVYRSSRDGTADEGASDLMTSLNLLDDVNLIRTYLGQTLLRDVALESGKAMVKVLARHGWATFHPELICLFQSTNVETIERHSRLLESICLGAKSPDVKKSQAGEAAETCRLLADQTIAALRQIDTSKDSVEWRSAQIDRKAILVALIKALLAANLLEPLQELVLLIQSLPERYALREVQLSALATLGPWLSEHVKPFPTPLTRWIAACRQQLETLTATIPQPPADFRRDDAVNCKCKDCAELKCFLIDASRGTAEFRMAMDRRNHLEAAIRSAKCDLDCKTVKKSNPHVLVCTKNAASYERRLKQYHEDLKSLEFMEALR